MKKLNRRETIILTMTLALTVVFIVYQFAFKPMRERSVDIDDQVRVDTLKLMKARQILSQKSLVEARYKNLIDLIGEDSTEASQMPLIISKIETAARDSNIHIMNIQPQRSVIQKEARFLEVELEIEGQWLDIARFFYVLQQRPDFYFINELNLEKYSDVTNSLRGRVVVGRMCLFSH
jgi:Tfp pilus assembly protein PilO